MEPSQFRTTDGQAPETTPHRLRVGAEHTQNGLKLKPGDVVELTPRQAVAFADKFERVVAPIAPTAPPEPPAPEPPTVDDEPAQATSQPGRSRRGR